MPIVPKDRKIFYSRAEWHDTGENLHDLLLQAHRSLDAVDSRTFRIRDYEIKCLKVSSRSGGITLLDITKTHPDSATGVVPKPSGDQATDVAERRPPAHHDFLAGEVFALIAGNNLLCLPSEGATEYTAYEYIREILAKVGRGDLAATVGFEKVANVEKEKLIRDEGAKSIKYNVSVMEAELLRSSRLDSGTGRQRFSFKSLPAAIVGPILELLGHGDGVANVNTKENLMLKLELSWRKNRKGADAASHVVEHAAERLVDEQTDGFSIVTNSGKTVTHDQIRLNKPVSVMPNGNSLQRADAFSKLIEYYDELRQQCLIV